MNKTLRLYVVFLVLLLVGIVVIDVNRPKPINWLPTYNIKDKIPFGLFVLENELPTILKNQKIKKIDSTPYEYLESEFNYDTLVDAYKISGTLVNITENNEIDDQSAREFFTYASRGNTVFLSMQSFPQIVLDSLKIEINGDYDLKDSLYCWMANKNLDKIKYNIIEGLGTSFFSKIDTLNTKILGYQTGDSARVNFIKIPFGDGQFLLHTQPAAFTNFHLLKKNHYAYAENMLSYLPKNDVFWFVKNQYGNKVSSSPFRFILAQPALKWAWYIFLLGMIVFMVFNAKRRQRIVPIIKPLQNTTVDFAKTIGNLYFQEADYGNMMDKKIVYFLEKVRQDYMMDTTKLDELFIKRLHQKTAKDMILIEEIVRKINNHRKKFHDPVENDLLELNRLIEALNAQN